ncbi:hypothetical protein [Bdellovibrio bacteriovorus]|uniref:hypothetical protein n=1 Tax=Bdellovibrio bacteriovorus TaxID=959 RepID=UPI0035A99E5B
MSSFVEEFKKYQRQERLLTGAIVLVSVLAPVSFTALMNNKIHWSISCLVAATMLSTAMWIHVVRNRVSEKLLSKYETLDVGSVLAKKLTSKNPRRFVITNRGYNHYYLKCLNTGEQVLVSKHRVQEDFDIAN